MAISNMGNVALYSICEFDVFPFLYIINIISGG